MGTKTLDNRWVKRYRLCFVLVIGILLLQVFLALRFFSLGFDKSNSSGKGPSSKSYISVSKSDSENSVNNGKRSKDALPIDDEDAVNIHKPKKNLEQGRSNVINLTKLRLEELDFVPSCEIRTKEAISAIHRAKTQNCKQKISNITCLIQKGKLYAKSLPNFCPSGRFVKGRSLGCFKDEQNFRLLNGYFGSYKETNSPENCINLCLQSGFPYAGVQYSVECFCGDEEPPSSAKLPDSSCNLKCPADPHKACGGYYTVNIFETGIKKFAPQIASTAMSLSEEKPVRIVFLLTLNGRALRQVLRLLKILYHRDHYYFIHVDVRQDYLFRELQKLENTFPNVRMARKRFATIWGGASLLTMLMSSMKDLLKLGWNWDFVLNLSESDYPVKPIEKLVEFLTANRDRNFVKSHGREVQRFIQKQGLDKTFVECDAHMWRTGDRKLPWGIQIDGGSDWVALSRKFVEYISKDNPDELIIGLLKVFEHTLLPAESFFHTVLRNSKFCNTYIDNNLHVTNWKRKLGCKCQYKHVVDWCGCSPNDFKPEDWPRIQGTETRQLYFARKFEPAISQSVILQLELWILNKESSNKPNINSYWQSVYHHFDLSPSPDDSLLTIASSALRTKLRGFQCEIIPHKIIEILTYHTLDSYESSLVTFLANLTEDSTNSKHRSNVKFEVSFKPKNMLIIQNNGGIANRIATILVSSDYDQKEQMFRNFPGALGPYSEPVLMYVFNSSRRVNIFNATFIWIDPAGRLAEVNEVVIDDTHVIGHFKLSLKPPLLPGAWLIKLLANGIQIAETKFLITPLEFMSANKIAQNQVVYVHSGSEFYIKDYGGAFDQFLPSKLEKEKQEQVASSNARRFGKDLIEWIDSLFAKFYSIGQICLVKSRELSTNICGIPVKKCSQTKWSSFSPDPKSTFSNYDNNTGTFIII